MRFSTILSSIAMLALGGCAFFIPENPSAPRYTTLQGERHVPALNPQGGASAAPVSRGVAATVEATPAPSDAIAAADVAPPAPPSASAAVGNAFPPVDAATRAQAEATLAQPTVANNTQARRVPVENNNLQLAGNMPDINSVPARPLLTGDGSTEQQLTKVREQLERDRAASDAARGALATDAAAEPSLLKGNDLPPPAAPVAAPAAAALRPGAALVPPAPTASGFVAPAPLMPPPPPPAGVANVPFAPAVAAVTPSPSLAPIVLRPPVPDAPAQQAAAAPVVQFANPAEAAAPSNLLPTSSGFDPLASGTASVSHAATAYASGGYLPNNRYTR